MTLSPAPVPEQEGLTQEWVSVPKVPTEAMLNAPLADFGDATLPDGTVVSGKRHESRLDLRATIWAKMLAASPTPPAGRKALETTAQRYLDAVAFLGTHYTPDKRSFFEASPSKDEGVLEAWQELNDAGVALKAALAAGGAA